MNRPHSVYSLTCYGCERDVEIPVNAGPPYTCVCGAGLQIEFRPSQEQITRDLDDRQDQDGKDAA